MSDSTPDFQTNPAAQTDPATYFIEGGNRLKVLALAEDVEDATGRLRSGPDGGLYRYDDGVYREDGEAMVRREADAKLGFLTRASHVAEVVHHFENREAAEPLAFDPPRERVVYAGNGILHLGTDWRQPVERIEPYTPDNAWLARVPWDYDPAAPAPARILAFLREVFVRWDGERWVSDEDTIRYVLALIGLAMIPRNVLRRAVLFHGKGRNGKSILLHFIRGLLGAESVSAVSLEALGSNRFAAAELRGRLGNICGDISADAGRDSSLFKQMTGDDPIYGERKFGQPFTFSCGAMPFWSCNVYPRSSDVTPAYMSRWAVIHFERQFPENAGTEAALKSYADDPEEMRGLLRLAVENAAWLLAHPHPTTEAVPQAMREAKRRFGENADTVKAFADEALVFDPAARIEGKQAYGWYKSFCEAAGMAAVGRTKFYERLEGIEGVERGPKTGNKLHFAGIELDETWTADSGVEAGQEMAELFLASNA